MRIVIAVKSKEQISEYTIDRWYDRQSRMWIVQLKDGKDNQVGDAYLTPRRSDAASYGFNQFAWTLLDKPERHTNPQLSKAIKVLLEGLKDK